MKTIGFLVSKVSLAFAQAITEAVERRLERRDAIKEGRSDAERLALKMHSDRVRRAAHRIGRMRQKRADRSRQ